MKAQKRKAIKVKVSKTDLENFQTFEIDPFYRELYEEKLNKKKKRK